MASVRTGSSRISLEATTATMQPFFQVILHEEDEQNIAWAFEDAIRLCEVYGHVDLKKQLIQARSK